MKIFNVLLITAILFSAGSATCQTYEVYRVRIDEEGINRGRWERMTEEEINAHEAFKQEAVAEVDSMKFGMEEDLSKVRTTWTKDKTSRIEIRIFAPEQKIVYKGLQPVNRFYVIFPIAMTEFIINEMEIKFDENGNQFKISGFFGLGGGSDGINLEVDDIEMKISPYRELIPAGSFTEEEGIYKYKGQENGITEIEINLERRNFKIEAASVDLSGINNPVEIKLVVGDDIGMAEIKMEETENKWVYPGRNRR